MPILRFIKKDVSYNTSINILKTYNIEIVNATVLIFPHHTFAKLMNILRSADFTIGTQINLYLVVNYIFLSSNAV